MAECIDGAQDDLLESDWSKFGNNFIEQENEVKKIVLGT
jgi:hypothetical protein